MRSFKTAAGMLATIGALAACAAPATAHQFTASRLPKPLSEAEPGRPKATASARPNWAARNATRN